jgi:hypothetical protein
MLTSRLVAIALFAALLSAAPFHAALAQTAPDLGTASTFAVLGGPKVTLTNSAVIGDVGSGLPGSTVTLTTSTIVGTVHQGDAVAVQTYGDAFVTIGQNLSAYDELALEHCTQTILDAAFTGNVPVLGPLAPGVYCFPADVTFTSTTLTLDAGGNPNAVWIFKIGTGGTGALTGTGFSVVMANGGQPCNVYWWVAEAVSMTTSNFKGTILAGAATTFTTGGSLIGRVLAKAGVTMTGFDVFGCSNVVPPPIDYCKEYCKDYCKEYWKDHDKYHCKDHEKDYCKDHYCQDHDKNRCTHNDKDKDNDKDHRGGR